MPDAGGVNLDDVYRDAGAPGEMNLEELRRLFLRPRSDALAEGDDGVNKQGFVLYMPLEEAEERRPEIYMKGNEVARELSRRRKAAADAENASTRCAPMARARQCARKHQRCVAPNSANGFWGQEGEGAGREELDEAALVLP
eukprot:3317252-Rhodomonas_salina.2